MTRPRRCPLHPTGCTKHDNPTRPRLNATPPQAARLGADKPTRRGSGELLVAIVVRPGTGKQRRTRLMSRCLYTASLAGGDQ